MKGYLLRRSEIMDKIDQQEEIVRDSEGCRWLKCKICGRLGLVGEFIYSGGPNYINLGVCKICAYRGLDLLVELLGLNGKDD